MESSPNTEFLFRREVRPGDPAAVRDIVASAGFFNDEEVAIAAELAGESLRDGAERSGYHFVFADREGPGGPRAVGYACFGPIPAAAGSFDLYWIAVHADLRGRGLGRRLMAESGRAIAALGGRKIWIETASKPLYTPTRSFYESLGCRREAVLEDFYAIGDSKVIYSMAPEAAAALDHR